MPQQHPQGGFPQPGYQQGYQQGGYPQQQQFPDASGGYDRRY